MKDGESRFHLSSFTFSEHSLGLCVQSVGVSVAFGTFSKHSHLFFETKDELLSSQAGVVAKEHKGLLVMSSYKTLKSFCVMSNRSIELSCKDSRQLVLDAVPRCTMDAMRKSSQVLFLNRVFVSCSSEVFT